MCVVLCLACLEGKERVGKIVFIHTLLPSEQVPHLVADKPLQHLALQGHQVPVSCGEAVTVDPEGHRVNHMTRSWGGETQVLQRHILARVRQGRGEGSSSTSR